MKALKLLLIIAIVGFFIYSELQHQKTPPQSVVNEPTPTVSIATSSAVLGERTKNADCVSQNYLPDPQCTPGAVFPNVTKQQVCTKGYSASVRDVPLDEKKLVYAEYDITYHAAGEYEVDHFISLELGGSNDIANLWPEPASPTPGFHEKDVVENYLHEQLCYHNLSLEEAQNEIRNWKDVYNRIH